MSEYQHLKVEKAEGVARITFDRPKHNVLDIEMMNELNTELKSLAGDDQLKCLVIRAPISASRKSSLHFYLPMPP